MTAVEHLIDIYINMHLKHSMMPAGSWVLVAGGGFRTFTQIHHHLLHTCRNPTLLNAYHVRNTTLLDPLSERFKLQRLQFRLMKQTDSGNRSISERGFCDHTLQITSLLHVRGNLNRSYAIIYISKCIHVCLSSTRLQMAKYI